MRLAALLLFLFLTSTASAQVSQLGRLDPETNQGVPEMSAGKAVEAIATLSKVVPRNPDDYVAWYFLGLTQHGQGRFGLPNGITMSRDGKFIYVNDRNNKPNPEWVLRRIPIAQTDAKLTQ